MFKSPITKTGEVRYFEVIKYSLMIALFSYGYVSFANSNFVVGLLSGVSLVFVVSSLFLIEVSLVSTAQLIVLLKQLSVPIIRYIKKSFELNLFRITLQENILVEYSLFDNKIYDKLCVIRC